MNAEMWNHPPTIAANNFIYKSLSNWSLNVAVGCSHGCRFCYVPEASTNKMGALLKPLGVIDPDAEWGEYVFVRPFDEDAFRASLRRAQKQANAGIGTTEKADGNRAIMLCTTTDPYMTIYHPDADKRTELNESLKHTVRRSLEIIRDESDLNVRILTRSPLAVRDFAIMLTLGDRLMLGTSLPTLNEEVARIYEPNAPSPSKRREMIRKAKVAGLHVYVAVAPTYPECDREDLQNVFNALREIEPHTIFHEPINIRAENVARIAAWAESKGWPFQHDKFATPMAWAQYARAQLELVEKIAYETNLSGRLHLWPDKDLPRHFRDADFTRWCDAWWNRISEWPKTVRSTNLHRLNEKDEVPGITDTGRDRAGRPH